MIRTKIFIILFLFSITVNAQTPVYWYDVDTEYLEYLVSNAVNEIRRDEDNPFLKNELHLKKAAQHHANYLIMQKKLRHEQNKSKWKTPQQRVEKLGGKGFKVVENIIDGRLEPTYERTAENINKQWVLHSNKYRNITNPSYTLTGVGVAVNKNGRVVVVQLFSTPTQKESLVELRPSLKLPNVNYLPYKIKPYSPNKEVDDIMSEIKLLSKDGRISSTTPKLIKELFRHRNDGIVQEVVVKKSVDCNSDTYYTSYNERNDNSSINGRLYTPYYRKDLIRNENFKYRKEVFEKNKISSIRKAKLNISKKKVIFSNTKRELRLIRIQKIFQFMNSLTEKQEVTKKFAELKKQKKKEKEIIKVDKWKRKTLIKQKWKPFYWSMSLPKQNLYANDSIVEINMLILKKNKISYRLHYSHLDANSTFQDTVYQSSFEFVKPIIEIKPIYKELNTDVEFERNETNIVSEEFERFKFNLDNYLIDSISLNAFASVEGTKEINERLFKGRTDSLYTSLSNYHAKNIVIKHEMSENWPKLYQQLNNNSMYKGWLNLSQDSIRKLINLKVGEEIWESYLNEQRSALIKVVYHENILDTIAYLKRHYDFKNTQNIKKVLNYLIYQSLNNRLNHNYAINLKFHRDSVNYSSHILAKYRFEYESKKEDSNFNYKSYSRRFYNNINPDSASTKLLVEYLNFIVLNWEACQPDVLRNYEIFEELKNRSIDNSAMATF
ncbi:MAG: CAP domain-containing protein, partial [Cyclobacteriaceae bacterium]|nr:CAP domain-containing protein [Cyclobacteriaceae bacterium]